MEIDFSNKRILVTGANKGIGRAIALRLSKYGGKVIGMGKTRETLDDLVKEDPTIETVCVDIADWDATRKAVKSVLPVDLLVNNAGVACLAPFLDITKDQFDLTFDVNVRAIFNVSQVIAADMIRRKVDGRIVNLSSQAAHAALKDHSAYCASKGAVDMITKTLALELGPHGIRVNSVNPTVVLTAMGRLGWSDPAKARTMLDKIPLGRFAEVEEVVDAVVYLLSDRSSMISGVHLPVDGGFLAC
ncbi:L-xylulose reductase [Venturia canescens]|uniref:L-xylulose reductase n=1 Tax=Venturia canescens TaxID=32260 RepID=UPI001C9D515E|nr:L-xylulose reductase [Venturia canescens]